MIKYVIIIILLYMYFKPIAERFTSRNTNPYFETDFNYSNYDNEYFYDKSDRKPNMSKILPVRDDDQQKITEENDEGNINDILYKLELYDNEIYSG